MGLNLTSCTKCVVYLKSINVDQQKKAKQELCEVILTTLNTEYKINLFYGPKNILFKNMQVTSEINCIKIKQDGLINRLDININKTECKADWGFGQMSESMSPFWSQLIDNKSDSGKIMKLINSSCTITDYTEGMKIGFIVNGSNWTVFVKFISVNGMKEPIEILIRRDQTLIATIYKI